ncbi:AraC family transcriptional regulator [Microtetraspora sp. NBRC 13810]|uniref:helix-turn-helix domain-containing protein n=1 Tax=Microtetraspora sp. NBRC 13810 TaxID=3030990 RepID=UPI0024A2933E|nr:helix-turn-helix domain-containing protein [Microtetraspora sp. NBRC 13810]GLW12803.1 AraC family transcriptional regulator [Microtetraspora sp. NBRC 13810]
MLEKLFDSDDLPRPDRLDAWCDIVSRSLIPNVFDVDDPANFRASLRASDFGPARITAMAYSPLRTSRPPGLIRRSDPELYVIGLVRSGRQGIAQLGREAMLMKGELVLYSTSRPFETRVDDAGSTGGSIVAHFPRNTLPLPANKVDRLLSVRLPGTTGMGGLLAAYLTQLAFGDGSYRRGDAPRLGMVTLDLITALLAHHLDAENNLPAETRERALIAQVRAFIVENLGDPDLSPGRVASSHHVSLRYLQRLFQQHGNSVSAWIREQRLERARRDLADPALVSHPVHAISARWGFTHPAAFSRAFRAAYGISPRGYRHLFRPVT